MADSKHYSVADRNRPQQQRDKRMRRDLDVYRAGKKMRLSILSEPNHILGSRHAQTIIPNTVKTRYEKKLAKCRSELDISKFNSSKRLSLITIRIKLLVLTSELSPLSNTDNDPDLAGN